MGQEELSALRRVYDAIQRRDDERLRELLAHDVEWSLPESLPWGGVHHGPLGIASLIEVFHEHVEGEWAEPDHYLDAGDRIVVLGRMRGRARASGRDFEVEFAHVWALSHGVPTRVRTYVDTARLIGALQAPE